MQRPLLVTFVVTLAAGAHAGMYAAVRATAEVVRDVEGADALSGMWTGPQSTLVFDRQDRPVFSYFTEQRVDVSLDHVSPHMIAASLAAEDKRFYSHHGIDAARTVKSALVNVRAGRIRQGGSTITQQLARALELSPARTYGRKLREALLASAIERRYSKREILEAYLNKVYFGNGLYGVEAAARGYFGKPALALEPFEAATLAAIIRTPTEYARPSAAAKLTARRNRVLEGMYRAGAIDAGGLRIAASAPLGVRAGTSRRAAPVWDRGPAGESGLYFKEELRRALVARFGERTVYEGGLRVFATIDPALQAAAERAILQRLLELSKNRRAGVDAQKLQGALVAIDPVSGYVLAMVGGRRFADSPFNRVTQARRQPGSAFKPLLFAAALERGYAPASVVSDLERPIGTSGAAWLPAGEHEASQYTLRRALQVSSNRAAAQLMQRVGVSAAIDLAQRAGIASPLPAVPSLALGTGEVTLLELTGAYGAFANRGVAAAPVLIRRVEDRDGQVLYEDPRAQRRAMTEATAFLMSSMLADVVDRGTGYRARTIGFKLPAAGKTGTTDRFADTWFIGYTTKLLAGVWFGYDEPSQIMPEGFAGTVAVPGWASFMIEATRGAPREWLTPPIDVERVAICMTSGRRATDACRHAPQLAPVAFPSLDPDTDSVVVGAAPPPRPVVATDYFVLGTAPAEECHIHGAGVDPVAVATAGSPDVVPVAANTTPP